MLSYVPNHSKHSKTTKVIKWRCIASIWRKNDQKCLVTSQTIQNNSNLQKYSNYNELHRFDVKNIKTTQNYKSDQITMKCMDLTSKWTKMLSYVANHSKQRKSKKVIKIQWIASIWLIKNIKQRKTTKVIKLRRSAWIWRQNEQKCFVTSETIQNNANLQKLSKYNEVHGFDVKTNKNVELRRKPFKTTQIYKNDHFTMKCMDLKSKQIASIWCQNDKNVELLSKPFQTTQTYKSIQITMNCIDLMSKTSNNAKLQKWSNYDEVHGFGVKTNKNVELRRKPFKTTQI